MTTPTATPSSARIFVHPRCFSGPAAGALEAYLQGQGWDTTNILIGPPSPRGHCELVRHIQEVDGVTTYERMDGTQFAHVTTPPPPVAA